MTEESGPSGRPAHGAARMGVITICAVAGLTAGPARAQETPGWPAIGALFAERCTLCHSGEDAPLGLRLDTLDGARRGSRNGPVLVPGDPDASELVRRIRGESEPRMPLTGPPFLDEAEIAMVERWVAAGMPAGDTAAAPEPKPARTRPGPGEPVDFADVEPVFLKRCAECHKDGGKMGPPPEGLRLDTYAGIVGGGDRLVVLPGAPGLSELVRRIEGKARPRMPFDGPPWLPEEDISLIRRWIERGAADADGVRAPVPEGRRVRFRGTLTGRWAIDGAPFVVDAGTRIDDRPAPGDRVEVRGTVTAEGTVRATRLRRR